MENPDKAVLRLVREALGSAQLDDDDLAHVLKREPDRFQEGISALLLELSPNDPIVVSSHSLASLRSGQPVSSLMQETRLQVDRFMPTCFSDPQNEPATRYAVVRMRKEGCFRRVLSRVKKKGYRPATFRELLCLYLDDSTFRAAGGVRLLAPGSQIATPWVCPYYGSIGTAQLGHREFETLLPSEDRIVVACPE